MLSSEHVESIADHICARNFCFGPVVSEKSRKNRNAIDFSNLRNAFHPLMTPGVAIVTKSARGRRI